MPGMLGGKVAVVTGGASGIGRGIVERFVREGARVVIADLNTSLMAEVAEAVGGSAVCAPLEVNVTSEPDVERMVAGAVERFGSLDIAANCAFGLPPGIRVGSSGLVPFHEQDADAWRGTIDGALNSVFLCIKHESRQMVAQGRGGAIINISSINARQAGEGMSAYCCAKAGVEMLVRCAAMELGAYKVRVTGIAPGLVQTPATSRGIFSHPKMVEAFLRNTPIGRYGQPSDIAAAAAFLASEDASWVSGETLTVDGEEMTREYPRRFELTSS